MQKVSMASLAFLSVACLAEPRADASLRHDLEAAAGGDDVPVELGRAEDARLTDRNTVDLAPTDASAETGSTDRSSRPDVPVEPDALPIEPDALPLNLPLPDQNAFGAAGRVVELRTYDRAEAARREGCLTFGINAGTGIANLFALAGGIERFVLPDLDGRIALLILAQMPDFIAGQTIAELDLVRLRIFGGVQADDARLLYSRSSFIDGVAEAGPVVEFDHTSVSDDGRLNTPSRLLKLPLPVFPGLVVDLQLDGARIDGRAYVSGPGLGISGGIISGYIPDVYLLALVQQIKSQCLVESPPGFCSVIAGQLNGPDEAFRDLVLGIMGGYDANVADGRPAACLRGPEAVPACNAVSVCLFFEMQGVVVDGVSD